MSVQAARGRVDAARAYEQLLVPALFAQWAPRLVAAAGMEPAHRVLDVACGTGVLAREAAARVGPSGFVAGVDLDAGMLAVAGTLAPAIDWRQGAAESLPFPDRSFDVVVSQFGLMFFADPARAIREMLRVLTPGGRLAVAVWSSVDTMPPYAALVRLLDELAGPHAADALLLPFALGDRARLRSLFEEAGVAALHVTSHRGMSRFPNLDSMIEADLRGWLPRRGILLSEDMIHRVFGAARRALGSWISADGSVDFESHALVVQGSKRQPSAQPSSQHTAARRSP